MAIFADIQNLLNSILEALLPTTPPWSSLFILGVAFSVSLFSTLVSRLMIDTERLKVLTRENKKYTKMRMEMLKTADAKLKLKFDRHQDRMKKVQSELTTMRMKPLLILMIPMMLFFIVLSGFYSVNISNGIYNGGNIPAVIPFHLPEQLILQVGSIVDLDGWGSVFVPNYMWWYIGGSILFQSIFQKLAGLQPD